MSEGGYGLQKRKTLPVQVGYVRVGLSADSYYRNAHLCEQTTVSYRNPQQGQLVLEKDIDPYRYFLHQATQRKLTLNGPRTVSTVMVNGVEVATNPHVDNGHAFRTQKRTLRTSCDGGYYFRWGTQYYGGPFLALYARPMWIHRGRMPFQMATSGSSDYTSTFRGALPLISDEGDLPDYGKKAIVHLAPGYPDISVLSSIGELLLALPSLLGKSVADQFFSKKKSSGSNIYVEGLKDLTKGGAGEFLNLVFGVVPTFEDVLTLVKVFNTATDKLLALQAMSGEGVRRNMTFDFDNKVASFASGELDTQGEISCSLPSAYPGNQAGSSSGGSPTNIVLASSLKMSSARKVRFSGSFTRFLPAAPGLESTRERFMREFDTLYGSRPTPDRIWQLIPFSWLVDWFFDIQTSLKLADRVSDDSLLINYGYVTGLTVRTVVQHSQLTFPNPAQKASFTDVRTIATSVLKQRLRANPFGFITKDAVELNPLQLAILAAVGLTGSSQN